MNYIIVTRTRKLRRITETGGFWWVRDWIGDGFDTGKRITAKHAKKITAAALQLYVAP